MSVDETHGNGLYSSLPTSKLIQLCELGRILASSPDQKLVQEAVTSTALALVDADYGSVQILDEQLAATVTLRRQAGALSEDEARRTDQVAAGWVIENRRALNCADLAADLRFPYLLGKSECRLAILASPILCQDEMIGVLILGRNAERPFREADQSLTGFLATMAASPLQVLRRLRFMAEANEKLRSRLAREEGLQSLLGRSEGWRHVCEVIRNVAATDARLLLLGESGTGKEICARGTHALSPRRERPFVAVNCAAMPESLAESEFFGHVKGAFTGAVRDYDGLFAEADGGTLFLDEIGSAPLQIQASLLRAIQSGEVRRVGAAKPIKVDVRLICSTSSDLETLIEEGRFRKDLFYRINVVTLEIAPLRERRDDIPVLAFEFLRRNVLRYNRPVGSISPEALAILEGYSWPGNVRELEGAIEHAVLFSPPDTQTLTATSLPPRILGAMGHHVAEPASAGDPELGLDDILDRYERDIVRSALESSDWNQSLAARILRVPEKRIRERMKKHGLQEKPQDRVPPPDELV